MSETQVKSGPPSHKYCRKCYYILDGLTENRCPECGRPFDPLRRRTYRTRSRRQWWRIVALCFCIGLCFVVAGAGAFGGWVYWAYGTSQAEQAVIRQVRPNVVVMQKPWGPRWLAGWMRDRGMPALSRARDVFIVGGNDTDLARVAALRGVRSLDMGISPSACSDSAFLQLGELTELEEFSTGQNRLTDKGLGVLRKCPRLKCLRLQEVGITDAGLEHLAGLRHLESLTLKNVLVSGDGLSHLKNARQMKRLCLAGNLWDKHAVHLEQFPQLEGLDLDDTAAAQQAAASIGKLIHLKRLSLRNTPIRDSDLQQWGGLVDLRDLWLDQTPVIGRSFGVLAGLHRLSRVSLANAKVNDEGLRELARVGSLTDLDLQRTEITDAGIEHLARLPRLQTLNLTGTAITDACIAELVKLPLRELYLNETEITDDAVVKLIELRSLEVLQLDHTRISDYGLAAIAMMKQLQKVNVRGNDITYEGVTALTESRPNLKVRSNVNERYIRW